MRTTPTLVALGAMLAAGVVTACGTPAAQHRPASSAQPASHLTPAPVSTPTPGRSPRHRRALSFVSPSGDVRCEGEPRSHAMACVVVGGRRWLPPGGDDRWCHEMDLQGIGMIRGRDADFLCATDVLLPGPDPVLAYGRSQSGGGFTCWSRRSGITCTDTTTHHFLLSRDAYRLD